MLTARDDGFSWYLKNIDFSDRYDYLHVDVLSLIKNLNRESRASNGTMYLEGPFLLPVDYLRSLE